MTTTERTPSADASRWTDLSRRDRTTAEPDHCAQCGAPLAADQEWCVECGSSRTLIYTAPDWRVPVAVVLAVIALAIAGFAFALARLTDNSAPAVTGGAVAAAGATHAARQPGVTAPPTTTGSRIGDWPVGLSGWTVVLAKFKSEAAAYARAQVIAAAGTTAVGVFDSTDHPSMRPGHWIVFSGRFPSQADAQAAVAPLIAGGYTGAVARQVAPPGGL
ncbi:MAG: SPOR domain-containing protein [Solirubrobacteraceae bacterium]